MRASQISLKGPRVTIRLLRKEDLDVMSAWEPFEDPVDRLFDWPRRSPAENAFWFSELQRDKTRLYCAVDNESQTLIGRISLREIFGRHSARLGIGFGRDYVSQGYGTETLRLFLDHYFDKMGFDRIVLDVAAVNKRAIACYERCGFTYTGSHYQYAGQGPDMAFLQEEQYREVRRFFSRRDHGHWMLAYDMVLEKEDWLAQQEAVVYHARHA